jgi:hypothetical protein
MGIYRVSKTYNLIRMTFTSLLESVQKVMASPMVTLWVKG